MLIMLRINTQILNVNERTILEAAITLQNERSLVSVKLSGCFKGMVCIGSEKNTRQIYIFSFTPFHLPLAAQLRVS